MKVLIHQCRAGSYAPILHSTNQTTAQPKWIGDRVRGCVVCLNLLRLIPSASSKHNASLNQQDEISRSAPAPIKLRVTKIWSSKMASELAEELVGTVGLPNIARNTAKAQVRRPLMKPIKSKDEISTLAGQVASGTMPRNHMMHTLLCLWFCFLMDDDFVTWNLIGKPLGAHGVNVQRLSVPDLVVIEQPNLRLQNGRLTSDFMNRATDPRYLHQNSHSYNATTNYFSQNSPEAASLVKNSNSNTLNPDGQSIFRDQRQQQQQADDGAGQQITFECLISYDKKKDKNLIVKWHHDERNEPIYQWILEWNKRTIAAQYRPYIEPTNSSIEILDQAVDPTNPRHQPANETLHLIQAGFKLVRPTKELGGRYTCSAISAQNEDSKSKKMIVFNPPRSFKFNASRTDISALLASYQRERLLQLGQRASPVPVGSSSSSFSSAGQQQEQKSPVASNVNQLPPAYRMRLFEGANSQLPTSTMSPQMYSTIDYVNVNQQRTLQQLQSNSWSSAAMSQNPAAARPAGPVQFDPTAPSHWQPQFQGQWPAAAQQRRQPVAGIKLVCDIDQVFPVPDVSIYKLASLDGSHPTKLAKFDTRLERDPMTGLFHVQVISLLDEQEFYNKFLLDRDQIYFECSIALTNLELSRYADNKRTIMYKQYLDAYGVQDNRFEPVGLNAASNGAASTMYSTGAGWSLFCLLARVGCLWLAAAPLLWLPEALAHHQHEV